MSTSIPSTFYLQFTTPENLWRGSSDGRSWSGIEGWVVSRAGTYTLVFSTNQANTVFAKVNPNVDGSREPAVGLKIREGASVTQDIYISTSLELIANLLISPDPKIQVSVVDNPNVGTASFHWDGTAWFDGDGNEIDCEEPYPLETGKSGDFDVEVTDTSSSPSYPHYCGLYSTPDPDGNATSGTLMEFNQINEAGGSVGLEGRQKYLSDQGTCTLNLFQREGRNVLSYRS